MWRNTIAPAAYQALSDAITIVAWVKPSNVTGTSGAAIAPKFTICELRVNASDSTVNVPFSFGFDNSRLHCGFTDNLTIGAEVVTSDCTFTAGTLYMVAVTIDGDTVSMYRNGLLDSTTTLTTATGDRSVGALNSSLVIGSRTRDGGQADNAYYAGDITDFVIYDSALTSSEILKLNDYYLS